MSAESSAKIIRKMAKKQTPDCNLVTVIAPAVDRVISQWAEMKTLLDECHDALNLLPNQRINGTSSHRLADRIGQTLKRLSEEL